MTFAIETKHLPFYQQEVVASGTKLPKVIDRLIDFSILKQAYPDPPT